MLADAGITIWCCTGAQDHKWLVLTLFEMRSSSGAQFCPAVLSDSAMLTQTLVKTFGLLTLGVATAGDKHEPLAVCYLRHAFALGEHYNSVVPAEAATSDDEGAFEQIPSSS